MKQQKEREIDVIEVKYFIKETGTETAGRVQIHPIVVVILLYSVSVYFCKNLELYICKHKLNM